jgi:hypothetical protein
MAQIQIVIVMRNDDSSGITDFFTNGFGNRGLTRTGSTPNQY